MAPLARQREMRYPGHTWKGLASAHSTRPSRTGPGCLPSAGGTAPLLARGIGASPGYSQPLARGNSPGDIPVWLQRLLQH